MKISVFAFVVVNCYLAAYFSNASAAATKADLMNMFRSIRGSKIVSGQHNREPNSDPSKWTRVVRDITGLYPGLWGGDFLFLPDDVRNRQSMIDEAIRQWNSGSLVALTWHVCPPTIGETCDWNSDGILTHLTPDEWDSLIQDGGDLNNKWKARLDTIVPYLQQLKDAGVVVIWRPIHEMNEGWSWWGGRAGPNGSRKLYEITHQYLSQRFDNLIWTWCVKDIGESFEQYWPGANYVDIATLDVWVHRQPSMNDYNWMKSVAQDVPIALGEVGAVPSPATLEAQNEWVWFMVWAEYLKDPSYNSDDSVKETYYLSRTLRQGEIPDDNAENIALNHPVRSSSQENECSGPENINDGRSDTRWVSDESEEQWVIVDLEAATNIGSVRIDWEAAYAKGFQIQTSNDDSDNANWQTVYENYNGDGSSSRITLTQSVSARFVKLYLFDKGTPFRYSVKEFELFT